MPNDYTQERRHTARLSHLVDLYHSGNPEPLRVTMAGLGVAIEGHENIEGRFEWNKADFALLITSADRVKIVVLEFKVDSLEGNFFEENVLRTQTGKLAAAFEAEHAHECQLLYVTLGNTEFAGPPRDDRFQLVGLKQFTDAVAAASVSYPVLTVWESELRQELCRRSRAPHLAAEGHLRPPDETVMAAGYRSAGVQMAVYGAVIQEFHRQGGEDEFGPLRAYALGPAPDAILNVWSFLGKSYWYFEINANGTLNLKVEGASMNDENWVSLVEALGSLQPDTRRGPLARKPEKWGGSKTVCSWDIGLWKEADRPGVVVERVLEILRRYVPRLRQCT